jgi:hypothetical protein
VWSVWFRVEDSGEMLVSHSLFCMSKSVVGATDRKLSEAHDHMRMVQCRKMMKGKKVMAYFYKKKSLGKGMDE